MDRNGRFVVALLVAAFGCAAEHARAPADDAEVAQPAGAQSDGGADDGGGAETTDGPTAFVPGPLEAFPELSPGSATSLRQPTITLVSYDDDDTAADLATFFGWMVQSRWLPGVLAEYGVSPTSAIDRVILPGPAPARVTDDDTRGLLQGLAANRAATAAPLEGVVYVVLYPSSTVVLFAGEHESCREFYGYHESFSAAGTPVAFAVVPQCPKGGYGLDQTQLTHVSAAHELVEAVVDPYPSSSPAWTLTDGNEPWAYLGFELGDLCVDEFWREDGYLLPRMWSNARIRAGLLPCGPSTAEQDDGAFTVSASPSRVVLLDPGETATVAIRGWSRRAVAPWEVRLETFAANPDLSAALSGSELDNGGTLFVKVSAATTASPGAPAVFVLRSGRGADPEVRHLWPLVAVVRDRDGP